MEKVSTEYAYIVRNFKDSILSTIELNFSVRKEQRIEWNTGKLYTPLHRPPLRIDTKKGVQPIRLNS